MSANVSTIPAVVAWLVAQFDTLAASWSSTNLVGEPAVQVILGELPSYQAPTCLQVLGISHVESSITTMGAQARTEVYVVAGAVQAWRRSMGNSDQLVVLEQASSLYAGVAQIVGSPINGGDPTLGGTVIWSELTDSTYELGSTEQMQDGNAVPTGRICRIEFDLTVHALLTP
ncbi:MAG: hypothetical protein ACYDHP_00615 [Ferrimicrobium sp.]